ncbi:MAG: transcriptional repressor LexA [Armatimonadetes bacterium]|nr:transcriptional repressor LexA [Armatimonadota bacterium]
MGENLTARQEQILSFIRDFQRNYKRPPAVREIGDGVGLSSPCTVYRHLETLEKRGFIKRDRGKARSIEIMDTDYQPEETVEVPLLGQVAAGSPILAEENIEGWVTVSLNQIGSGEHFALRVRGESMIEDGILDGDVVICRKQQTATDHDMVVALAPHIDLGSATLKRFFREGDRVRLQPANQAMEPIYLGPGDDLQILGRAVMVMRQL